MEESFSQNSTKSAAPSSHTQPSFRISVDINPQLHNERIVNIKQLLQPNNSVSNLSTQRNKKNMFEWLENFANANCVHYGYQDEENPDDDAFIDDSDLAADENANNETLAFFVQRGSLKPKKFKLSSIPDPKHNKLTNRFSQANISTTSSSVSLQLEMPKKLTQIAEDQIQPNGDLSIDPKTKVSTQNSDSFDIPDPACEAISSKLEEQIKLFQQKLQHQFIRECYLSAAPDSSTEGAQQDKTKFKWDNQLKEVLYEIQQTQTELITEQNKFRQKQNLPVIKKHKELSNLYSRLSKFWPENFKINSDVLSRICTRQKYLKKKANNSNTTATNDDDRTKVSPSSETDSTEEKPKPHSKKKRTKLDPLNLENVPQKKQKKGSESNQQNTEINIEQETQNTTSSKKNSTKEKNHNQSPDVLEKTKTKTLTQTLLCFKKTSLNVVTPLQSDVKDTNTCSSSTNDISQALMVA